VRARAWNTGDGPKSIFGDGVKWLRSNAVLLPGVTTVARLVSRVRDEALGGQYATLAALPDPHQAARLESAVTVPEGARYSELQTGRKGPAKPTGRGLERSLNRTAEIGGVGIGKLDIEAHVPRRRVTDLARHGMTARAQALRRHGGTRRLATLVATVAYLEARSVDDCLELLDLLVTTELLGKAERAADKERARRHPDLARHSSRLADAVEVLLEVTDAGGELTIGQVWESIDAVVPRPQLRESVDAVADLVPLPGLDAAAETRARLTERTAMVTPFLKLLTEVITFGAAPEGGPALAAMKALPRLLDRRTKITEADIDPGLLAGSWKALVLPNDGGVDRGAWVFCVLTAFHRHLKRREIYAGASTRWRDPRAQLLAGKRWERAKGAALTALQLSEDPSALLAEQSAALDAEGAGVADEVVGGAGAGGCGEVAVGVVGVAGGVAAAGADDAGDRAEVVGREGVPGPVLEVAEGVALLVADDVVGGLPGGDVGVDPGLAVGGGQPVGDGGGGAVGQGPVLGGAGVGVGLGAGAGELSGVVVGEGPAAGGRGGVAVVLPAPS
jgi:hypothetical protein